MKVAILDDYQNVALRIADWSGKGIHFIQEDSPHEIANAVADFTFSVRNGAFVANSYLLCLIRPERTKRPDLTDETV